MQVAPGYPRLFGRYVLLAPLARGGMGELHLAVYGDSALQKLCVVKQVLSHLNDREYTQRFLDEANLMIQLSHGNLVPLLESGCVEGRYYIAMEYIEGKNLRELWRALEDQQRTLPLNLCLYVVKELCRGLSFAHAASNLALVHRDVSPPNVLLSYAGEVRLTDFGLALSTMKVQRTSPGILLGKLGYMSPEHARGDALDARSDIFSAGVVLWELATGRRLLDPELDQAEQLKRVLGPVVVPPSHVNPALPPALDEITRRALARRREERYADAESLRKDVAMALAAVDPTTDASGLQRFLEELYGPVIEKERQERQALLEQMAPEIKRLLGGRAATEQAPTEQAPTEQAPAEQAATEQAATEQAATEQALEMKPTQASQAPNAVVAALVPFTPGSTLDGKYLIHDEIGQGGMGRIFKATHLGIDRVVALKVLLPEYSTAPSLIERFQMEARAASRIAHPNIVEIFDSGTTKGGLLYFAMELIEGTDLADLLRDDRTLEINQALRIAIQITDAMAAAHAAGVIHRDLKPENILLVVKDDAPDFVKIVDFGIARFAGSRSHTRPGLAIGTPEYMAPEQATGEPYDERVDIFALGVMLYEMLAGHLPTRLSPDNLKAEEEAVQLAAALRQRRPDVPEGLAQLVLKLLSHSPADRLQSMAQLNYELRKLLEGRAAAVAAMLRVSGSIPRLPALAESTPGELEGGGSDAQGHSARTRRRWLVASLLALGTLFAAIGLLPVLRRPQASLPAASPAAVPRLQADAQPRADAKATARKTRAAELAPADAGTAARSPAATPSQLNPRKHRRAKATKRSLKRLEGTVNPFQRAAPSRQVRGRRGTLP